MLKRQMRDHWNRHPLDLAVIVTLESNGIHIGIDDDQVSGGGAFRDDIGDKIEIREARQSSSIERRESNNQDNESERPPGQRNQAQVLAEIAKQIERSAHHREHRQVVPDVCAPTYDAEVSHGYDKGEDGGDQRVEGGVTGFGESGLQKNCREKTYRD